MTKQVLRIIAFYAKAGEVSTAPPVGPLLGQFPIDVRSFANAFNAETKKFDKGLLLRVILILYKDGTFIYNIKTPPLSFLFELSSNNLLINSKRGFINIIDIYKIAVLKKNEFDFNLKEMFFFLIKQVYNLNYRIIETSPCGNYYYLYL